MPKRASNLEEANLTNVGFDVGFFVVHHFVIDPIHVWHGPFKHKTMHQ
jgi:hypothetical protein